MIRGSSTAAICLTCGTQFPPEAGIPERCPICEDERQYVGWDGQQWTNLIELQRSHHNRHIPIEQGITSILTEPNFAIGQRAFFIESLGGNVLWDCVTLLDDDTVDLIRGRGGLSLIAISHPHYYSTMVDWAETFAVPIYLHSADREWVMRHCSRIKSWEGEVCGLHDGMTLIRGGGHFEGGAMLHHPGAAGNRGALFSGDIIQVTPDRNWVSFMYSYPNLIPLSERKVRHLVECVKDHSFERIYGAFHRREVTANGELALRRSAERYIRYQRGDDR